MSRIVALLGAGASAEAGVPTAIAMTRAISELLHRETRHPGPASESRHLGLAFDVVSAALSGTGTGADIERVSAAVQLVAQRREFEIAPLISRWTTDIEAMDADHPGSYAALVDELPRAVSNLIVRSTGRVEYLYPLLIGSNKPTAIATLNYDLAVERAAREVDVTVDTGIRAWVQDGAWAWRRAAVPLLKLHGSVDWSWVDDWVGPGELPSRVIVERQGTAPTGAAPALVFGAREKLRAEGPFLSALAEFERMLSGSSHLLVVGYSFRDDHVNQVIRRWTWDGRRLITIVDPGLPDVDNGEGGFSGVFQRRLCEIARRGVADRLTVHIIRESAGHALARMLGS